MTDPFSAFTTLLRSSSLNPAAAAAAIVLSNKSAEPFSARLHRGIQAAAPHLSATERDVWVTALAALLPMAGITAPRGVAAFVGQCAVESAGFRQLEEYLYYSADRLRQVWPGRFPTTEAAMACAMQPEILANRVYADRMGNRDEASGDGWRFRGRGLIQITGRTAYQQFAQAAGKTLDEAVEYAATPAGAAHSAVWFWTTNQLNALAMTWSIDRLTQKINGGLTGAAERTRLCQAALLAIGI